MLQAELPNSLNWAKKTNAILPKEEELFVTEEGSDDLALAA